MSRYICGLAFNSGYRNGSMMFKHFQFSTIHQSLELVLKAKDIFIKLNNTLILPRVEGRDVLTGLKCQFCYPPPLTNSFLPRGSSIPIQYAFATPPCS